MYIAVLESKWKLPFRVEGTKVRGLFLEMKVHFLRVPHKRDCSFLGVYIGVRVLMASTRPIWRVRLREIFKSLNPKP